MALNPNAYMAALCFLLGTSIVLVFLLPTDHGYYVSHPWSLPVYIAAHLLAINGVLVCVYHHRWTHALTSSLLGSGMGFSVAMAARQPQPWGMFWTYPAVLAFFHWSEYMAMCWCQPDNVTWNSFVINHSVAYGVAHGAAFVEAIVSFTFLPWMKVKPVYFAGLACIIGGEMLRKTSMYQASVSFTHEVQFIRRPEHVLVTTGVYALVRHPSYVGWFWWSIGTQVMLCNPICAVAFALASWNFFNKRIQVEEQMLVHFFGLEYRHYQRRVRIGLPFISGFPEIEQ